MLMLILLKALGRPAITPLAEVATVCMVRSLGSNMCAMQVLTDAADSQHGTLAMLCLAALARGIASSQTSPPAAPRAPAIPQAKLSQMIKQLAPNLQVWLVLISAI